MKDLFLLIIITCLIACGSGGGNTGTDTTATADNTTNNDTTLLLTEKADASGMVLSEEEIKDDSVFSDGSIPVSWNNAGFNDPAAFKLFIKKLQQWVAADQKDSVAAIVDYPLKNPAIPNAKQFLVAYESFFNEKVKNALRNQRLNEIGRTNNGAMIGDGVIWIRQQPEGYRVIAINNK